MIPLYNHQKEIIDEDKPSCGIFQGTGSAKTRTSLELAKGRTLVICPKQQREDQTFQRNAEKFGINIDLTVISKEDFKKIKDTIGAFDTVIIDECHNMLGVLPDTVQRKGIQIPKTSQMFEDLRIYLNHYTPKRFYLLSATPASKPMHVFAIGVLLKKWDMDIFYAFREKYYIQQKMGYRSIWLPKNTSELKERLAELINQMGYTGDLFQFFDVPEQTHKEVYFGLTSEQKHALQSLKESESDPMAIRTKSRTIENGCLYDIEIELLGNNTERITKKTRTYASEKISYILERAEEFPKLLIFANYTGQIHSIEESLKKEGYTVFVLTGKTKDRGTIIQQAEDTDRCIVIAQCDLSSGYELKSIPVVIYASKSYRLVNYIQSMGRVLRADKLKKNLYLHLIIKGSIDELCHKTILSGEDFQERIMNY